MFSFIFKSKADTETIADGETKRNLKLKVKEVFFKKFETWETDHQEALKVLITIM